MPDIMLALGSLQEPTSKRAMETSRQATTALLRGTPGVQPLCLQVTAVNGYNANEGRAHSGPGDGLLG